MSGHGHVIPNADGSRARCGGPAICAECSAEYARIHNRPENPEQPDRAEAELSSGAWQGMMLLLCFLTKRTAASVSESLYSRVGTSIGALTSRETKGLSKTESRKLLAETCRALIEALEGENG